MASTHPRTEKDIDEKIHLPNGRDVSPVRVQRGSLTTEKILAHSHDAELALSSFATCEVI